MKKVNFIVEPVMIGEVSEFGGCNGKIITPAPTPTQCINIVLPSCYVNPCPGDCYAPCVLY